MKIRQCSTCYTPLSLTSLINKNDVNFLQCSNCKALKRIKLTGRKLDDLQLLQKQNESME